MAIEPLSVQTGESGVVIPREILVDLTRGIRGIFLAGMGRQITPEDDRRIDRYLDARCAARKLLKNTAP